jgi:hypothetical protein
LSHFEFGLRFLRLGLPCGSVRLGCFLTGSSGIVFGNRTCPFHAKNV